MSKTIAVFGVGTGLGRSLAHRFGREGFNVALLGRTRSRLDGFAAELAERGIAASAFTVDLAGGHGEIVAAAEAVERTYGHIDVLTYGPAPTATPTPFLDVTTGDLRDTTDLYLFAPVRLIEHVLPGMRERGDGAVLVSQGMSAAVPLPALGEVGPAMAAMRNYVLALNQALDGTGVYAGTLTIGAMIERSAAIRALTDGDLEMPPGLPVVDPDDLADTFWEMYVKRDRAERTVPA